MQDQHMDLVLSTDAKPRLKWTSELHKRFVEAVTQLGGANQATPKSLLTAMSIPGLTLYHLKSHLQKYRLVKSQQLDYCSYSDQEYSKGSDYDESEVSGGFIVEKLNTRGRTANTKSSESFQITQALDAQMEVQKKLSEQIEVQRHLQLRIEAQGIYLQSILKKAQETLAGCNSSSPLEHEALNGNILESFPVLQTRCLSSSISGITETCTFSSVFSGKRVLRSNDCSVESSLTSSESSEKKYKNIQNLPRKRSRSSISHETSSLKKPSTKKSPLLLVENYHDLGLSEELNLNKRYQSQWDLNLELKL